MRITRLLTFTAIALASAGLMAGFSPLNSASADNAPTSSPNVAGMLNELAPGATAHEEPDGSIAIHGVLTPTAEVEARRAAQLAEAGPNTVRCPDVTGPLLCTAVADDEVLPALRAGEDDLYGRTVYRSLTRAVADRAPVLEAGELVCTDTRVGSLECRTAADVPPVLPAGESAFVTYKRYNVTFDSSGQPTLHVGTPTIPLARG